MHSPLELIDGRFEVTALGVGHGDAILLTWIVGQNRWTCLIDGGVSPDRLNTALDRHEVSRIDLLVLSHFDNDHLGGLLGLSSRIKVVEYWGPATRAYARHLWIFGLRCREAIERAQELEEQLRLRGVSVSYPLEGYQSAPRSVQGPRIEVLSPPARFVETLLTSDAVDWLFSTQQTPLGWMLIPEPPDFETTAQRLALRDQLRRGVLRPADLPNQIYRQSPATAVLQELAESAGVEPEFFGNSVINNSSLVLWVEFCVGPRKHRILLTGDQENWSYICGRNPRGLQADLMKAAHHGGRVYLEDDSVAYHALMKTVRPRSVLVSACGQHDLPRAQFRDAAAKWGSTVFCTSRRGREVVLAQIDANEGNGRCCHQENGCSKETNDVTITFNAAGVAGDRPACHSGWGGDSGPVIQLQQHLIASSPIGQRLLEHELSRHLHWIKQVLRRIDRERREKSDGNSYGYEPIPSKELVATARADDPPRNDLVANISNVLVEGMNRRSFWVNEHSREGRDLTAYAWPTKQDVLNIRRVLHNGPPLIFPLPENYRRLDVGTIVSSLDTIRFEILSESLLCLPRAAFKDTIWPHIRRTLIHRWHGFATPCNKLLLAPNTTAVPTLKNLLDRYFDASINGFIFKDRPPPKYWALLLRGGFQSSEESLLRELLLNDTPIESCNESWNDIRLVWDAEYESRKAELEQTFREASKGYTEIPDHQTKDLERVIRLALGGYDFDRYGYVESSSYNKSLRLVHDSIIAKSEFENRYRKHYIRFEDLYRIVDRDHRRIAEIRGSCFQKVW